MVHGRTSRHIPAKKSVHFNSRLGIPWKHESAKKKTGKSWVVARTRVATPRVRPAAKDNPIPLCCEKLRISSTTLNTSKVVKSGSDATQVEITTAGGNISQRTPANHPASSEVSR